MKPLLMMFGNIVFAVSTVAGVFAVATNLSASEPVKNPFSSVYSEGIWTREPTRIDRAAQNFERIDPVLPAPQPVNTAAANPVSSAIEVASLDATAGAASLPQQPELPNATMSLEHQAWCQERYRSYNAADNSYRAFSGQRRACQSPYSQAAEAAVETQAPVASVAASYDVQACMQRYRSYDARDNTYQPFDGGPRRQCTLM